jgi:hypothetical protein
MLIEKDGLFKHVSIDTAFFAWFPGSAWRKRVPKDRPQTLFRRPDLGALAQTTEIQG